MKSKCMLIISLLVLLTLNIKSEENTFSKPYAVIKIELNQESSKTLVYPFIPLEQPSINSIFKNQLTGNDIAEYADKLAIRQSDDTYIYLYKNGDDIFLKMSDDTPADYTLSLFDVFNITNANSFIQYLYLAGEYVLSEEEEIFFNSGTDILPVITNISLNADKSAIELTINSNGLEENKLLEIFYKDLSDDFVILDTNWQISESNIAASENDIICEDRNLDDLNIRVYVVSRQNVDDDGDTLSNGIETFIHGSNPNAVDTDNDGVPDNIELERGTDLLDSSSYAITLMVGTDQKYITIQSAIDAAYNGDTIELTNEYYIENNIIVNKNVSIIGKIVGFGFYGGGLEYPTIYANSSRKTAINRIFEITNNAEVTIANLNLQHGYAVGSDADGGAVLVTSGNLTLENCELRNNDADDEGGALLCARYATCTIKNCIIDGNTSVDDGGGIQNNGTMEIFNSAITNNSAGDAGAGLESAVKSPDGSTKIYNTTISGNSANKEGGGIRNIYNGPTYIYNSTIAYNTSNGIGGGICDFGGEIEIYSTIVANNAGKSNAPDIHNKIDKAENSLISNTTGVTIIENINSIIDVDPQLESLADNGGNTLTHCLKYNSPAINAGINPMEFEFDQRGTEYNRIDGTNPDIGAYEVVFINVPEDYSTIQNAIVNARGGEIIIVNSEQHIENNIIVNKKVSIIGKIVGFGFYGNLEYPTIYANSSRKTATNRIFEITNNAEVTIANLNLQHGYAVGSDADGGAVLVTSGNLTLENCELRNNDADDEGGALLCARYATCTINNCIIDENSSVDDGGGIQNNGTMEIFNTAIINNSTGDAGAGLESAVKNPDGSTKIYNTTISGNSANKEGGGIRNIYNGPTYIYNSTIAYNTSNGIGGGICDFGGVIEIYSTIVANNAGKITAPDIHNKIDKAENSIIGNTLGVFIIENINSLINVDPKLEPLANNGGGSFTHALQNSSPAINTGINPMEFEFDQRGDMFNRVLKDTTDIGAFESNYDNVENHPPIAVNDIYSTNEDTTLNINITNGVLANDTDADNDTLTAILVSDVSNGTLTLNNNGSFNYIPTANFAGTDSFTYKANDGIADSNIATVTIVVGDVFIDSDNDGMDDTWENYYFGNLDQTAESDFDNDGVLNYVEYLQGRNPTKGAIPDLNNDVNLNIYEVIK